MITRQQMQWTILQRLFWRTAERNDAKMDDHLFHHKELDLVFALDEATLFDFFFHYLREFDVSSFWENIAPKDQKRTYSIHTIHFGFSDESHPSNFQDGTDA